MDLLEDGVRASFDAAVDRLRAVGVTISDVDIPHAELIAPIYVHIVFGDAAAYHAEALERVPEQYTPNVRARLDMARYVLAEDYVRALDGRRVLRREVDAALRHVDALVLPTLPIVAPPLGAPTVSLGGGDVPVRNVMLRLTQLFNITGNPAISLPCGVASGGLPCGLQVATRHGETDRLLQIARTIERTMQ